MILFLAVLSVECASAQIPKAYREELGLLRHEERLRAANVPVTGQMKALAAVSGRLSDAQHDELWAFFNSANPLQIEWLICESVDALRCATTDNPIGGEQLKAISQALVDYAPVSGAMAEPEPYAMWAANPKVLAARLADITGAELPEEMVYRAVAIPWLKSALGKLEADPATHPKLRAACQEIVKDLEP